jgi:hypothetical protein
MSKYKIKNSQSNPLITFLKDNQIVFYVRKNEGNTEEITFSPRTEKQKQELLSILNNYGDNLYHDSIVEVVSKVSNEYNYISNQYENMTRNNSEIELPLHYLENTTNQNSKYEDLKSIATKVVNKSHINNILNLQQSLVPRSQEQLSKFQNIYFGNEFKKERSKKFLGEFPYHNRLKYSSLDNNDFIGNMLRKFKFQEEIFSSLANPTSAISTDLEVNSEETQISMYDILSIVNNSDFSLNESDKLILATEKKNSNYISSNFKKFLLENYLENRLFHFTKTFTQIYENEPCEKEYIIYKIQKFKDTDSSPTQTFWMYEEGLKEYIDYQIKLNSTYRYLFSAYIIVYGTSTSIETIIEGENSHVTVQFIRSPSYRMAILDFDDISLKVSPKIPMPPFVVFQNESNSENYIKIYLDLKNFSKKEEFISITDNDSSLMSGVVLDDEGRMSFEYSMEEGKFEVFRLSEKPKSYINFENAKILDVSNKHSSTSVVFKDNVMPNKKYYYMFRAVNIIGMPSNPTPIYEVEMIKDASKSKIIARTIDLQTKEVNIDKTFKSLLQITPAFQQDILNDQSDLISELPSFQKRINEIPLGTAADKIWGKKFKIRVKSKDSGKIIDLNVKFKLTKDNIK